MKIITFLNSKGGCGKTTACAHVAAGMAMRGYRVLVADADPQGHATLMLGSTKAPHFYDLFVRDAPFADMLLEVNPALYAADLADVTGSLYLLPGNKETRNVPDMLDDVFSMGRKLAQLESEFDIVIIDTSPTASVLNATIQLTTDAIIYPTHCEYLSLDGLAESLGDRRRLQDDRTQRGLGGIHVLGILPTMYQAKTHTHKHNLGALRERFGAAIWKPLPRRVLWSEAAGDGRLMFAFSPNSAAALEAWNMVNEMQERFEAWALQTAGV